MMAANVVIVAIDMTDGRSMFSRGGVCVYCRMTQFQEMEGKPSPEIPLSLILTPSLARTEPS